MRSDWCVAAIGIIVAAVGCANRNEKAAPLRTGAFAPQERTIGTDPMSPVDRSGPFASEHPQGEPVAAPAPRGNPPVEGSGRGGDNGGRQLQSVVRENMESPVNGGRERAATMTASSDAPATATGPSGAGPAATGPAGAKWNTGASSGQYMTIGGIVAEVNSTPIYADKVVGQIAHVLAARARETPTRGRFRDVAAQEIRDQVLKLINLELAYAAAQRNLDEQDRELASNLAADWRRHKIAEAQGSEELARKRAAEQGMTFEEIVAEQHRYFLSQLYWQKRIVPRIQVTADDLRRYYDQHLKDEFTVRETARFRLIKISVKQVGDRAQARKKIEDLRQRVVVGGEDFGGIASAYNDPVLARQGELTVQRGAFGEAKVEEAVWGTPAGAVTEIVETPDAFYIAKVEEKKAGRVIPFEEEQTQQSIRERLRAEQFKTMLDAAQADLRKDAIIRSNDEMMNTAVEMAMENYAVWSGKG